MDRSRVALRPLSIKQNIELVVNKKKNETQPDFRVLAGDVEIGAAWNRKAISSGNDFVSMSLAAPEFGDRTLYANLGPGSRIEERKGVCDYLEPDRLKTYWSMTDIPNQLSCLMRLSSLAGAFLFPLLPTAPEWFGRGDCRGDYYEQSNRSHPRSE